MMGRVGFAIQWVPRVIYPVCRHIRPVATIYRRLPEEENVAKSQVADRFHTERVFTAT